MKKLIESTSTIKLLNKLLNKLFPFVYLTEPQFVNFGTDFQDGFIEIEREKYDTIESGNVILYGLVVYLLKSIGLQNIIINNDYDINGNDDIEEGIVDEFDDDIPYSLIKVDLKDLSTNNDRISEHILRDFMNRNIEGKQFYFHMTSTNITRFRVELDNDGKETLYEHFTFSRLDSFSNNGPSERPIPMLLSQGVKLQIKGIELISGKLVQPAPEEAAIQVFSLGKFNLRLIRFMQGSALMFSLVLTAIAGVLPVWDENKRVKIASVVLAGLGGILAILQFIITRSFALCYGIDPSITLVEYPLFVRLDLGRVCGESFNEWVRSQKRLLKFLVLHQVYNVKGRGFSVFRAINNGPVNATCNQGVHSKALSASLPTFYNNRGSRKLACLPDPFSDKYYESGKAHVHSNTVNSASNKLYDHHHFKVIR